MDIFLDCLPCTLKQTLEAARMATQNIGVQEKIMEESIKILADYRQYPCSPDLARAIHQVVHKYTGCSDPYKSIKERDIQAAISIFPMLKDFLNSKKNRLYWALKIAATGNIIDAAIYNNIDFVSQLDKELEKEFSICDSDILEDQLKTAKNLLIIGDNSGETVFDKILAEYLVPLKITYAVRNAPVLNDVTVKEAFESGLGDCTTIISSGCDAPGLILEECSPEFIEFFNNADIVISKGQGNFEALSEQHRDVFFLLKAKCSMVARKFDVDLNGYVLRYSKRL